MIAQWMDPTPEQILEAQEMARNIGQEPYWQGRLLCVGENSEEPVVETLAPVSPRQARLALLQFGLLQTVEDAITQMTGPEGQAARVEWEYATSVERNSPMIAAFKPLLGFSDQQIDELFRVAQQL